MESKVIPALQNPNPEEKVPASFPRRGHNARNYVDYGLLGFLFLACSFPIQPRIGNFPVYAVEFMAVVYIVWRVIRGNSIRFVLVPRERNLVAGYFIATLLGWWIWFIALNWMERTDLVWAWSIATVFLALLVHAARQREIKIETLVTFYVLAALPNSIVAIYQHFTVTGLIAKGWAGWSWNASLIPVTGFFGHPNDMAVFQYWVLILSAGLAMQTKRWGRLFFGVTTVIFGIVLFWTVSRTTLITVAGVAVLLPILLFIRSRRIFTLVVGSGAVLAGGLAIWILPKLPMNFFSGRFYLWSRTVKLILHDPYRLVLGFVATVSHPKSEFWIPHNLFLYAWIFLGWGGVLLLGAVFVFLVATGWKKFSILRRYPLGAIMWIAMGCFILITGFASLYLHEVFHIFAFTIMLAFWMMMLQEVDLLHGAEDEGKTRESNFLQNFEKWWTRISVPRT